MQSKLPNAKLPIAGSQASVICEQSAQRSGASFNTFAVAVRCIECLRDLLNGRTQSVSSSPTLATIAELSVEFGRKPLRQALADSSTTATEPLQVEFYIETGQGISRRVSEECTALKSRPGLTRVLQNWILKRLHILPAPVTYERHLCAAASGNALAIRVSSACKDTRQSIRVPDSLCAIAE